MVPTRRRMVLSPPPDNEAVSCPSKSTHRAVGRRVPFSSRKDNVIPTAEWDPTADCRMCAFRRTRHCFVVRQRTQDHAPASGHHLSTAQSHSFADSTGEHALRRTGTNVLPEHVPQHLSADDN